MRPIHPCPLRFIVEAGHLPSFHSQGDSRHPLDADSRLPALRFSPWEYLSAHDGTIPRIRAQCNTQSPTMTELLRVIDRLDEDQLEVVLQCAREQEAR